jgi:hypothetical protein
MASDLGICYLHFSGSLRKRLAIPSGAEATLNTASHAADFLRAAGFLILPDRAQCHVKLPMQQEET